MGIGGTAIRSPLLLEALAINKFAEWKGLKFFYKVIDSGPPAEKAGYATCFSHPVDGCCF